MIRGEKAAERALMLMMCSVAVSSMMKLKLRAKKTFVSGIIKTGIHN